MSLTHDSPHVRKSHAAGWKHRMQVQNYYSSLDPEKVQAVLDRIALAYQGYDPNKDPVLIAQYTKTNYSTSFVFPLPKPGMVLPPDIRPPPPGWVPPPNFKMPKILG